MTQFFPSDKFTTSIIKIGPTSVRLPQGSRMLVGGLFYTFNSDLDCDLSLSGAGGLDTGAIAADTEYYVYAVLSGGNLALVSSLSASAPTGFSSFNRVGKVQTDNTSEITVVGTNFLDEIQESQIETLQFNQSQLQSDVAVLQGASGGQATDITNLQSDVGNLQTDVSDIEAEQITQNNNIADNTSDISDIQADVGILQASVSGHTLAINSNTTNIGNNALAIGANTTNISNNAGDILQNSNDILALQTQKTLAQGVLVDSNGGGDYTTIGAAIAAVSAGAKIVIAQGSYTENLVITKKVFLEGLGHSTVINGTVDYQAGSERSLTKFLKITGNVTVDNGVTGLIITDCWLSTGATLTDNNPTEDDSLYNIVTEV